MSTKHESTLLDAPPEKGVIPVRWRVQVGPYLCSSEREYLEAVASVESKYLFENEKALARRLKAARLKSTRKATR